MEALFLKILFQQNNRQDIHGDLDLHSVDISLKLNFGDNNWQYFVDNDKSHDFHWKLQCWKITSLVWQLSWYLRI